MLRIFFLIIMLFCNYYTFSQRKVVKFGEIDKKTLEEKTYEKYKDAPAVILYDYVRIQVIRSGDAWKHVANYYQRIKILNKEGFSFANIERNYYKGANEDIVQVKGYTYNLENGEIKKTKLEKSQIFEVDLTKKLSSVKITMPNVKEGSVIDIAYRYESDNISELGTWYFQSMIPSEWSEVELAVPQYFNYIQLWNINQKLHINETFGEATSDYKINGYRWAIKDLPAFKKDEKFIATPEDYLNKVYFQLSSIMTPDGAVKSFLSDWGKFIKEIMKREDFGEFISKTSGKTIVEALIKDKNDLDKIPLIFEYVKSKYKYNGVNGILTNQTVKDLLDKKTGSSAEINLLLVNLLRLANIEAHPVILSTRYHGMVTTEYPIWNQFNYCVVYAKNSAGQEFILDATNPMHAIGMVAEKALVSEALLILPENKHNWISLKNAPKTSVLKTGFIHFNADITLKGSITTQYQGYKALKIRNKLKGIKDTLISESINIKDTEISKIQFKNLDEENKPVEFTMDILSQNGIQQNGEFIYLTPLMNDKMGENPFKDAERLYPIDFTYPTDEIYAYTFTIPDNFQIEEIPTPLRVQWADGKSLKYDYVVKKSGNTIQVSSKLIINRAVFKPEEYGFIRDLYSKIIAKQEEQIVLKKIK